MCPLLPRQVRAGELIFAEGEPGAFVWFVSAGTLALAGGGTRGPGDFLGLELLVSETYADSATAVTEVLLCGGPKQVLDFWFGPAGGPARMALEATLREALALRARRRAAPAQRRRRRNRG